MATLGKYLINLSLFAGGYWWLWGLFATKPILAIILAVGLTGLAMIALPKIIDDDSGPANSSET